MEQFSLLTASAVIPVLVFVLNLVVRSHRGVAQSTGADLLLLLLIFDAQVVIAHRGFKELMVDPRLGENIIALHLAFLFVALILWFSYVTKAEERIIASYNIATRKYNDSSWFWWWISSWLLVISLVVFQVLAFTYRI